MSLFSRIVRLQASVFYSEPELGGSASLAERLVDFVSPIKAFPVPINVPADAPPELPRAILLSTDQSWQVVVNRTRADFALKSQNPLPWPEGRISEFWKWAQNVTSRVGAEFKCDIVRVAAITEAIATEEEIRKPLDFVSKKFFSPSLPEALVNGQRGAEFHIRRVHPIMIEKRNIETNIWTRLRVAELVSTGRPAMALEIDINSTENAISPGLTPGEIVAFFEKASIRTADEIKIVEEVGTQ
jgi:hypothetical protein